MASRRDYYYRELVTEAELDAGFEGLEDADRALVTDFAFTGVHYGLGVSQKSGSPNISVDVAAGATYDQDGQRCLVPSTQNVNVAVDSNNTSTTVAGVGNERWVSVFLVFDRALSDQRTDGNSNPVMFVRDESFKFTVVMGAEAAIGAATRPGLLASGILLADVRRTNGQTQVLNADISTTRRQWPFAVSGSPRSLARGRVAEAFTDVVGWYNNHVNGLADNHTAAMLNYAGGAAWADGTTNPAATVEAQLDKIITDLAVGSGSAKIAAGGFSVGAAVISAGTLHSQVQTLAAASAHNYAGGGSWLDGATNPQVTVEAQLDKIITDLTNQTASNSGAHKLGIGARTAWLGGRTNPATTIFAAVDKIITDLAATTAGDDGAERVGIALRSPWIDTTANAATTVYAAVEKIITDLSLSASALDGTAKVGFFGAGNLSTGSARSALLALDGRAPATPGGAYTYSTRGGTIASPGGITAWTDSPITVTVPNCKTGQKFRVQAVFGIGGTPTGAYSLRLMANGNPIPGTEVDAEVTKSFAMGSLYTIPGDGGYDFKVQYQNPSTGGATMTLLGSASLVAHQVY